jgi:hypothetical protein
MIHQIIYIKYPKSEIFANNLRVCPGRARLEITQMGGQALRRK